MDAEIYSAILYAVIAFLVLWIVCLEYHFATKADEAAGDDAPTAADAGVAVADGLSPPRAASTGRTTAGDDGVSQRRWAQAKCAVLVVVLVLVALFLTGCEGEGGAYCSGEGVGHQDIHGHVEPWLKAIMDFHAGELGDLLFFVLVLIWALVAVQCEPVRRRLRYNTWHIWNCVRRAEWAPLLLITFIVLGGLANRIRGGWLGTDWHREQPAWAVGVASLTRRCCEQWRPTTAAATGSAGGPSVWRRGSGSPC